MAALSERFSNRMWKSKRIVPKEVKWEFLIGSQMMIVSLLGLEACIETNNSSFDSILDHLSQLSDTSIYIHDRQSVED